MDLNKADQRVLKYRSKTDARGRIIYFLSGVAYFVMALSFFFILYKLLSKDKPIEDQDTTANDTGAETGAPATASSAAAETAAETGAPGAEPGAPAAAKTGAKPGAETGGSKQQGGAKCRLPTILYIGVIAVALGLVWTTLRIRNGNDFLTVY